MRKKIMTTAFTGAATLIMVACVHAGSIVGEVKFTDAPPQLKAIKVTKDQDYCGETLPNEIYLIEANSGLKNAVVFLESAPPGKQADPERELSLQRWMPLRSARDGVSKGRKVASEKQRSEAPHPARLPR
jgi:hypothetical protein